MKKYLIVMKNTWDEILTYRFNFAMWRFRTVITLLPVYFLWASVMPEDGQLFGYSREMMLTYIIGTQVASSFIFSTRTHEIAENINSGDLSIFLIRPWGYFKYWFFRDLGDKAMNIVFSTIELFLIFLLLAPPLFIQTNPIFLILCAIAIALAILLNFFMSCLLSLPGFWSPEVWAPRFIFYILLSLFTGGIFPLDILPKGVFEVVKWLPFPYLQYYPIKIYLGQVQVFEILMGFLLTIFWIVIFHLGVRFVWNKGIKMYTAAGR